MSVSSDVTPRHFPLPKEVIIIRRLALRCSTSSVSLLALLFCRELKWSYTRNLMMFNNIPSYAPFSAMGTKRGRQRQSREARKIFLHNPHVLLSISLLWLPSITLCFYFRLKTVDSSVSSSWNVGHVLKTAWKWSSWSLRTAQMSAIFSQKFTCTFCLL